jgi:hypothetical protein
MTLPSALWQRIETIHAVTYFAPECEQGFKAVGLRGFWMGYFAGRAAPMGAVEAPVVTATFFNFHPAMVERAIPDAWGFATPAAVLDARVLHSGAVLRRAVPDLDEHAARVLPLLERAVDTASCEGRPLAAANRGLARADDNVHRLWQATTTLREHRGDGHVAVLTSRGLGGCDVHVLLSAYRGVDPAQLRKARGWSDDDWTAARERLAARGWLDRNGALTEAGHDARDDIERRTDALAEPPYAALGADAEALLDMLTPMRDAIVAADIIRFPTPMGLPRDG